MEYRIRWENKNFDDMSTLIKYLVNLVSFQSTHLCYSCFKFQRLLLKMYEEYIRNVKS